MSPSMADCQPKQLHTQIASKYHCFRLCAAHPCVILVGLPGGILSPPLPLPPPRNGLPNPLVELYCHCPSVCVCACCLQHLIFTFMIATLKPQKMTRAECAHPLSSRHVVVGVRPPPVAALSAVRITCFPLQCLSNVIRVWL